MEIWQAAILGLVQGLTEFLPVSSSGHIAFVEGLFKIDDSRFYTVFYWMTKYLKLKGAELIVFAIVFGYSQDKASEFYGSLGYMEELGNLSRPTVVAALDSLEKFITVYPPLP